MAISLIVNDPLDLPISKFMDTISRHTACVLGESYKACRFVIRYGVAETRANYIADCVQGMICGIHKEYRVTDHLYVDDCAIKSPILISKTTYPKN